MSSSPVAASFVILHPSGVREARTLAPGVESLSLKEMQQIVCGHIEVVPVADPTMLLVVNENGGPLQLPFNPDASVLARRSICGTVLYCSQAMLK